MTDEGGPERTQRTVAELLAKYGDSSGEAAPRRRRRRAEEGPDTSENGATPQAIIDRVLSDSGTSMRPIRDGQQPPDRVSHRQGDAPRPAPQQQRPMPGPPPGTRDQASDDMSAAELTRPVPPVPGGRRAPRAHGTGRFPVPGEFSGAFPVPGERTGAYPPPGERSVTFPKDLSGAFQAVGDRSGGYPVRPAPGPAPMAEPPMPSAPQGALADEQLTEQLPRVPGEDTRSRVRARADELYLDTPDDFDLNEPLPGAGRLDDRDHDEDVAPTSAGREWLIMAGQLALGVVGGAAVWLGFNWLWSMQAVVALLVALAVIVGLVLIVRKIRKADDLQTTVLAVLVGLIVTVSPAALLLLGR
jgi:hypothetical protein